MVRDQMQEVILVEVADLERHDAAPAGGEFDDGPSHPSLHGPPSRPRRWRALAAAVAALLVVSGVAAGVRSQRATRLAAVPGVLAPVSPSLGELWRVPQRGWAQVERVDDDIILFGPDHGGEMAVVSLDGATGEQRWSMPLPEVSRSGNVWCVALGVASRGQASRLGCLVVDDEEGAGPEQDPTAGSSRLLVLDAGTGEQVAERPIDLTEVGLASFGRDLIATEVLADGRAKVTREDPVTGQERWAFVSAAPIGAPDDESLWLYPNVQNGVIVVNGPVTWAFGGDGEVLGEWRLRDGESAGGFGPWIDVNVLPDGRFAVGRSLGVGGGAGPYGTVSTGDAQDGFPIQGPVLPLVVDDGSASDVLFIDVDRDGGVVALDSRTGEQRWEWDSVAFPGDALVLDGRFITVEGRELRAHDAHSGHLLWTLSVPMGNQAQQVFTDGRLLLVPMYDREAGPVLVAFDPADGRQRWSAGLPAGVHYLSESNGGLLAMTDQDVIALG